jgi:hypothetical protein
MSARSPWAQAWVALRADDPEAVSALAVARRALAAGRGLLELRRHRLFELRGDLPGRVALEDLLHRSSQFYNPHKETCVVRLLARDPAPLPAGVVAVLVSDRGGERRPAAERWWAHVTGTPIEVREGVAWALRFADGVDAAAAAAGLVEVRDAANGLLCNPHAQVYRGPVAVVPLPWLAGEEPA